MKGGPVVCVAVVLAGNAALLTGVARNRAGGPHPVMDLSEMELPVAPRDEDNTGLFLELRWRNPAPPWPPEEGPGWLDQKKLEELGFDCRLPADDPQAERKYRWTLPRPALVVLELGDRAVEAWSRSQMPQEPRPLTRLVAVDAGTDAAELRRRYPDATRFAIVHGTVHLSHERRKGASYLRGIITNIHVRRLNVPLPHRRVLEGVQPGSAARYTVSLAFGSRQEPWITDVRIQE